MELTLCPTEMLPKKKKKRVLQFVLSTDNGSVTAAGLAELLKT